MMRKIQITVILLVLAPSILIAGVMYYYTKSAIVEEKYESLAGITQMMDFYISQRYNTLISDISKKTEMDILKRRLETQEADSDKGSYNETREKIKQLLSQNVSVPILEGALVNLKGEVILSNRPQEEGLILNKTNLYNSIMSGAESYMGLVIEPGSTEKVEIAVPVFDNNERITGIIKQIITLDKIVAQRTEEINLIHQKLLDDLEYARDIQLSMLPKTMPDMPGTVFEARYFPAERVSGDFYNIFKLNETKIGIYIGDVSGHGATTCSCFNFSCLKFCLNFFHLFLHHLHLLKLFLHICCSA
jgi:hypothetical protein